MALFERDGRRHPGTFPFVGALAAWTLLWLVLGVRDILTQTTLGRGATGASVDAHEIMEALFVAAYSGIRWAVGAAILVAGGLAVREGMRRIVESRR